MVFLDSKPQTLRLPGKHTAQLMVAMVDYFSKPSTEDIFEKVYQIMHEVSPEDYPSLY